MFVCNFGSRLILTNGKNSKLVFFAIVAALSLIVTAQVNAAQVTINLSHSDASQLSGFRIYYKTDTSGPPYDGDGIEQGPSPIDIPIGSGVDPQNVNIDLAGLQDGTHYFFTATAYDANGNESNLSNEGSYTTPAAGPQVYNIASSSEGNGTIAPAGDLSVYEGESAAYSFVADEYHHISDIIVDGVSVGAVSNYTLNEISSDHTISAVFAPNTFTIKVSAGSGGTMSPSGTQTVVYGQSVTYTAKADPGYHLSGMTVDGKPVDIKTTYTFSNINADHTIIASFAEDQTFTINASAGENGSISPAGNIQVISNSSTTFEIKPDPNYQVADLVVDGQSIGARSTFVMDNVSADHTVVALFETQQIREPTMEYGEVSIYHSWMRVSYKQSYVEPVVVAAPLSYNGGDPAIVRIRNVNSDGFEIRVQEWPYLDGAHIRENVAYLVMERGSYLLADGTRLEASVFDTASTSTAQAVLFEQRYNTLPVVVSSVVSNNEEDTVTGRIDHIDLDGFEYRLQEQESSPGVHAVETVAYIAWEPSMGVYNGTVYQVGVTASQVTDAFTPIMFKASFSQPPAFLAAMQTTDGNDTACIRWKDKSSASVQVKIEEEQSLDEETGHVNEVVGYFLLSNQVTDSDGDGLDDIDEIKYGTDPQMADTDADGINDADEVAYWAERWNEDADNDGLINLLDQDSDGDGMIDGDEVNAGSDPSTFNIDPQNPLMEIGQLTLNQEWTHVALARKFNKPVVLAGPLSHNGGDPAVVRIRNVDGNGFDIRVQEWDYLDGQHIFETVGYIVIEQGQYQLSDGTRIEAGIFNTAAKNKYANVNFSQSFKVSPVVMTSVDSINGENAVTGRTQKVSPRGFSYTLQEQESNKGRHEIESVAYLAWEPSTGNVAGLSFQVGSTDNVVSHNYFNIMFDQPCSSDPVLLADMQTTNGNDPANIRYSGKDIFAVDVKIDEEQSADNETDHVSEAVGYMVFYK